MNGDLLPRADVRALVDGQLHDFLDRRVGELLAVDAQLGPVTRALREATSGGKALRAQFCYWGWRGAAGEQRDEGSPVFGVGAALELFHLGCLVHDDVMDRSSTRRGRPTVHRLFADRYAAEHPPRDGTAHGDAVATLVGDLCLTWSDQLFDEALADVLDRSGARRVFDLMRTQVMAGQYLDLLEQGRSGSDPRAARTVVRFKSAKYTVEHPLVLGGAVAGASPTLLARYAAFGLPVGEAFQLRDDVLGVLGDPAVTGKPSGDDLREGKRTVLIGLAEQRASPGQRRILRRHVGDPHLTEERVADVRAVLLETGAVEAVELEITRLTTRALRCLEDLPVHPESRDALESLTRACAFRAA